jgi:ribosomal protein S15
LAQARARKAASLSRKEVLTQQRAAALGDPVRGITTPFVQSFDTADTGPNLEKKRYLKHFMREEEVEEQLQESRSLSKPAPPPDATPQQLLELTKRHEELHKHASNAVARIIDMQNSNAQDRLRVNIQRCIETFGRHNTDKNLPPKSPAFPVTSPFSTAQELTQELTDKDAPTRTKPMERAGPDTGSSEVQIAILTAKIRSLANFLETRGKKDKVNKRNLRLLVHRRQKLLKYLRRKERGGPRYQRCVEMLGLTEGTWKGEISL